MTRLLLALTITLPSVTSGLTGAHLTVPVQPAIYLIDGYLDRAPEAVPVLERVQVGARGRERSFLLTAYRRLGTGGDPWGLIHDLHVRRPDFILQGPAADIARILDAPPGSRVRGTFHHLASLQTLVINPYDLTIE